VLCRRVLGPPAVPLVGGGGEVLDVWQQWGCGQPSDGGGDEIVVDEGPWPVLRFVACEVDELGYEGDVQPFERVALGVVGAVASGGGRRGGGL